MAYLYSLVFPRIRNGMSKYHLDVLHALKSHTYLTSAECSTFMLLISWFIGLTQIVHLFLFVLCYKQIFEKVVLYVKQWRTV